MSGDLFAVLMAGGSGTRFWPASRRDLPKQFLPIAGSKPLIVETWERLDGLVPPERRLVVAGASQAAHVRAALPELAHENLLLEPRSRNTAAAIAMASAAIAARGGDRSVQIVLPSDHVIRPSERFRETLRAAVADARASGALVTLGVRPTHPATGFGYIEVGSELGPEASQRAAPVTRFVEKPSRERALEFLARGNFYWNSGLFVWRTDAIERALTEHAPKLAAAIARRARGDSWEAIYDSLDSVSIDVAVMERASNVRLLAIDYLWSDVGSWDALADTNAHDEAGNVTLGGTELATLDAQGCIVYGSASELVALIGVDDLIVVHASGVTLVCAKDRAQSVKDLVARLERERKEFL